MRNFSSKSGLSKIALVVIIALVIGFIILVMVASGQKDAATDFDTNSIIAGNEYNGGIGDHVKGGNPDAKVIIFEYADLQCSGCATMNPRINAILDEYDDADVALVFRYFNMHSNSLAASSAAEAAGLQGYWEKYTNYLFTNQSAWFYASADQRTDLFASYFANVTNGEGDIDKFKEDMGSAAVNKKINFDISLAKKLKINATPTLIMNGKEIDFSNSGTESAFSELMHNKIDEALAEAKSN